MTPRISFITLVCNRTEYLKDAFDSLRHQDVPLEIVVIDSSKESQKDKVFEAAMDLPLTYAYFAKDKRWPPYIGRLWNIGINLAQGDTVAFLDDDDEKYPQFSQRMLSALDGSGGVAVVCPATLMIDKEKTAFPTSAPPSLDRESLLKAIFLTTGQLIVRRSVFDRLRFDDDLPVSEDYDFAFQLSALPHGRIGDPLVYHRCHSDNLSGHPGVSTVTQVSLRRLLVKHGVMGDNCSFCGGPLQTIPVKFEDGGWNWQVNFRDGRWTIHCGFCNV